MTGLPGCAEARSIGGPSLPKRLPPMLTWSLPPSLADLLAGFRPCFTTPTLRVFMITDSLNTRLNP
jgi:hypothetical protein